MESYSTYPFVTGYFDSVLHLRKYRVHVTVCSFLVQGQSVLISFLFMSVECAIIWRDHHWFIQSTIEDVGLFRFRPATNEATGTFLLFMYLEVESLLRKECSVLGDNAILVFVVAASI